jgi:hypothetical protein
MRDQISLTSREILVLCYSHLFIPLKYLLFDQVFFSLIAAEVRLIQVVSTALVLIDDFTMSH